MAMISTRAVYLVHVLAEFCYNFVIKIVHVLY